MPSLEELEAKREELADLQRKIRDEQLNKDAESSERRRQAEFDRLEQEIAFAKQSEALLDGLPPQNNEGGTNLPPDNSTVKEQPSAPSFSFGGRDNEDGE